MAGTVTLYLLSGVNSPEASGWIMFAHTSMGNLIWAYLIGRAAVAVLAHLLTSFDIREMWSANSR